MWRNWQRNGLQKPNVGGCFTEISTERVRIITARVPTRLERKDYEESLKTYRDLKNTIDTAFDDGKKESILKVIINAKQLGLSKNDISKLTGLTEDEINKL